MTNDTAQPAFDLVAFPGTPESGNQPRVISLTDPTFEAWFAEAWNIDETDEQQRERQGGRDEGSRDGNPVCDYDDWPW